MVNKINRISACTIVFNEEKKIRPCLKSLQGCVDEIIVIHDGKCSDKTLKNAGNSVAEYLQKSILETATLIGLLLIKK